MKILLRSTGQQTSQGKKNKSRVNEGAITDAQCSAALY